MAEDCPDLIRFVRGEIEARSFPHREHVRIAFEMLRRHDFATTVYHFSHALRSMAARAGKPEAFHQTITIAFLALIGERMQLTPCCDFESFARDNPELFERSALGRWYGPERLGTAAARRTFLLPEPRR